MAGFRKYYSANYTENWTNWGYLHIQVNIMHRFNISSANLQLSFDQREMTFSKLELKLQNIYINNLNAITSLNFSSVIKKA